MWPGGNTPRLTLTLIWFSSNIPAFVYGTPFGVSQLTTRGDCRTTTVVGGDSCGSLVDRCGITAQDFTEYNPSPSLCSTLAVGQLVCCSSGTLPDLKPKPGDDGSCATYIVKEQDYCYAIAAAHGLTIQELATFNDEVTWGWSGCDNLGAGLAICLSTGSPPMPQSVANAVCGPLKPGSVRPAAGQSLADLNPCSLNSCCTIWGQCGITPEFCTAETGPTGNPGTAPLGHNGCISNCNTSIVNDSDPPESFISIGYYESWNFDRECLNLRVEHIDTSKYTHVHWGFGLISTSFEVSINDTYGQWSNFTGLNAVKKIVSFGGWGFSTNLATYDILRNAMNSENVAEFTDNVVQFVIVNNLDGVDFDWEYPGAPDIPGLPPGLASDGPNYLAFLTLLRDKLPKERSISIAAPASHWYLEPFPIAEMAEILDYIVYMTYDLHGQWDYGNKWSQEGCPEGNCLRSHVNLTETFYALAMITKAGVPTNKITVGVSSYGRAFGMEFLTCAGPTCHFLGPQSYATHGICTDTAGYISNAEIDYLVGSPGAHSFYDEGSYSDILVYNELQWVAYMSDTEKASRTSFYKFKNFLGTADWAIDLQAFHYDDDGNPSGDDEDDVDDDDLPLSNEAPACTASYNTMEELDAAVGQIPDNCKNLYTVMTLSNVLKAAVDSYNDMMKDGYDGKFKTYAEYVSDSAGSTVRDFVNSHGNDYFTCVMGESSVCCDECAGQGGAHSCNYCFTDDVCYITVQESRSVHDIGEVQHDVIVNASKHVMVQRDHPHSEQVLNVKSFKQAEPCPPDYSERGYGPDKPYMQSVWWTLLPEKADQFYADLTSNTGITKDKIALENYNRGNGCLSHAKPDDECWLFNMDYGMPTPEGYGVNDVTNPKDIAQKALDSSSSLQEQINALYYDIKCDGYYGDASELVDAISIPVLLIADAVDNMSQVQEIAEKIDDEKKKEIILAFISAILFFIPVAGEILGSIAGLAELASVLAMLGAAGDLAMGVYTLVDDPKNPLLGIFGIVMAPLGLLSVAKVSDAATLRRGMSDEDILKLGGKIGGRLGTIKKLYGTCKAR